MAAPVSYDAFLAAIAGLSTVNTGDDGADCVSASSLVAGAGVLLMPIILDALPKDALPIGVHEY